MEFSRQEYWSGLPFPTPGNLPNPGMEPMFPSLAGRFFSTVTPGKPIHNVYVYQNIVLKFNIYNFHLSIILHKADVIFFNFKLKSFQFNLKKERNENRVIDED